MAQPVIHFEISASNREKAVEFYSKLFDWKTSAAPGFDYSLVEAAGKNPIGGGIGPVQPGQTPFVTFYVGVDDLQATSRQGREAWCDRLFYRQRRFRESAHVRSLQIPTASLSASSRAKRRSPKSFAEPVSMLALLSLLISLFRNCTIVLKKQPTCRIADICSEYYLVRSIKVVWREYQ